jgi:hypothetical protein
VAGGAHLGVEAVGLVEVVLADGGPRALRQQVLNKLELLEGEVGRAIAPATPQAIGNAPVRRLAQLLPRERRPPQVAAQTLQTLPVATPDARGVER